MSIMEEHRNKKEDTKETNNRMAEVLTSNCIKCKCIKLSN